MRRTTTRTSPRAAMRIFHRRAALILRNVAGVPTEPALKKTLSNPGAAEMNIERSIRSRSCCASG